MIVPDFWAEARRQYRQEGKQVTVRRFGWSVTSKDEAIVMAESRAEDALKRILAGENLKRREPKVAYNGAEGVPIREEVLERHPFGVITRNIYGAWCLNSENALFADVDFAETKKRNRNLKYYLLPLFPGILSGFITDMWPLALGLTTGGFFAVFFLSRWFSTESYDSGKEPETGVFQKIDDFINRNPSWNIRIYRTPAGFRLLATHRTFNSDEQEVHEFFNAVSVDPLYFKMCINQKCFRARLTPKPWRMGIKESMKPRPGVWPVAPEHMKQRKSWIKNYEACFSDYASCRFENSVGSGKIHESIQPVIEIHDKVCRAFDTSRTLA